MTEKEQERLFQRACELRDNGAYLEALKLLETLTSYPSSALSAYIVLGDIYWRQSKRIKSIHCFERATQIDPQNEIASRGLFVRLWELGQLGDRQAEEQAIHEIRRLRSTSNSTIYDEIVEEIVEKRNELWSR